MSLDAAQQNPPFSLFPLSVIHSSLSKSIYEIEHLKWLSGAIVQKFIDVLM